ncbi:MAG: saccharopine dehydrogenase family protein [Phycisphaerales bacterium]
MANAIVLGAGMVGSVMAADLADDPNFRVTVADIRPGALELAAQRTRGHAATLLVDLADPEAIQRAVAPFDIVLGALSSHLGLGALRAVIAARKPYCDISFMAEDAIDLSAEAERAGVTAIVDCGVAPGMSNLLAGYATRLLDPCESIEIYVGGLPVERRWPYEYKAGFSPADVLEEYTRPSRIVEHGQIVVRPALSEPELMDLPGVGTLEAFNTDGLRSIATTLKIPFMKEKTLRYPGHIALMRAFRETGLFSKEPITVNGQRVVPLDVTSALMFPKWKYETGERDLTVMRVSATGKKGGVSTRLTWDVLDFLDPRTGFTSMSRTTAFPCTILARLVLEGAIAKKGVLPPELFAERSIVERIFAEHAKRGIHYRETVTEERPA